MEKFFKIKERGSTLKTEIFAGITTFFAMAYIIFVNPNQVAAEGANGWLVGLGADPGTMGQIWNSVYIASIIVAIIGTLLMAFVADMPFAQACGMGLNSFFCTIFVAGSFFAGEDVKTGYQAGLVIVFLSGIVFLLLSVTGLRKYIAVSMPECLKKAIPAGIGLFIAMIGFKNAGIIEDNQYTFVQFYDFHGRIKQIGTEVDGVMVTGLDVWHQIVPVVVALLGVLIIAILAKKGIKSNVIIGILASAVLYYLFMWEVPSFDMSNISQSFKDFAKVGFLGVFNGDAWDAAFNSSYVGGVFSGIMLIVAFCLVDMFDTIGTIYGTAASANMMDENGDPISMNECMLCDSIGTVSGALLGTSTCTTFVDYNSTLLRILFVLKPACKRDPKLCNCTGSDLCRCSYGQKLCKGRYGRYAFSSSCVPCIDHDAFDIFYLKWYRYRCNRLCCNRSVHRQLQEEGYRNYSYRCIVCM